MKKHIFFAGYYDVVGSPTKRKVSLASKQKTDYLILLLKKMGYSITVFSCAEVKEVRFREEHLVVDNNLEYYFAPSFYKNKLFRKMSYFLSMRWLKKKIINNCLNSIVVSYHSINLIKALQTAKRKINFKLVSEVEEIYSDTEHFLKNKKMEMSFFEICDAFVTITDKLNQIVNPRNKPHVTFYGPYDYFSACEKEKFGNEINMVYAGTSSKEKGGLKNSLILMKNLSEKFKLHLLISDNISSAFQQVEEVLGKNSKKIAFIGQKQGDDLKLYLSKCDIGLALQNIDLGFNESSFPSKTLLYYCCGLSVLSTYSSSIIGTPFEKVFLLVDENWADVASKLERMKFYKNNDNSSLLTELEISLKKGLEVILNDEF